jgi:hypothetical protein
LLIRASEELPQGKENCKESTQILRRVEEELIETSSKEEKEIKKFI